MTYDEIYSLIERASAEAKERISGIEDTSVNLNITGSSGGTIGAAVTGGHLTVHRVRQLDSDAEITVSADDLYALLSGKLNPVTAMMSGKIRISGNMAKLMRVINSFR